MSQKYKKIGVTTGGYRGERAVLEERVIEGFIQPEFDSLGILQLNADSEQTIYLTNTNTQNGNIIVLPNASTLWNNWRTTIINNSSYSMPIYYFTEDPSNSSNLILLKEITGGNMTTFILLDNTSEQGTWTTFRTAETVSAETTEKYTSDVYEKFNISYTQVIGNATYYAFVPTSGTNVYTVDNPINTGSVLYDSNLQALNPQPTFTVNPTNWVLQNMTNYSCDYLGGGIYQGGTGKYLTTNSMISLNTANSWEIKTKYTYAGGGNLPTIFGPKDYDFNNTYSTPWMYITGNNAVVNLSSNGSSLDIANAKVIISNINTNVPYYIKLKFDSSATNTYTAFYSTVGFDDPNGTTVVISQSTSKVYTNNYLSFLNALVILNVEYSNGTIDLEDTSITIDSVETKFGYMPEQSITIGNVVYTRDTTQNINPTITSNAYNLSNILAKTAVKSIYFKPTEQFVGSSITVSIGTVNNPTQFFNAIDISGAVSNTNFSKDLFDEILSNISDTQIIATFNGSNLNGLTAGNLEVVIEKVKTIDPSVLKNAIVSTQVPIGTIFNYAFDDTPVGYVRLNGSIIDNANNVIPNFVEYLNKVNSRLDSTSKIIISNQDWETEYATYGSCGKFTWYNTSLRFPAINCFIKGLNSVSQLGKTTGAGLPNITGTIFGGSDDGPLATGGGSTGALYIYRSAWKNGADGSNGAGAWDFGIDASRSNPIYGNSNTVTPINVQYPYIMSVFNKVQWTSQADYDALIAASVNKANINLDNVSFTSGFRRLIEIYKNDNGFWYKVFMEYDPATGEPIGKWCEQGGIELEAPYYGTQHPVTFLKEFKDINYTIFTKTFRTTNYASYDSNIYGSVYYKTTMGFYTYTAQSLPVSWYACGYID